MTSLAKESTQAARWTDQSSVNQADVIDEKLLHQLVLDKHMDQATSDRILRDEQYRSSIPGWRLVLAEAVDETQWSELVGDLFGIASAEVSDFTIDRELFTVIPEALAVRYHLVPLTSTDDEVYIGISDPTEIDVYDHIRSLFGRAIRMVLIPPTQIDQAIRHYYMNIDTSELEHIEDDDLSILSESQVQSLTEGSDTGEIVTLVDRLFAHAIQTGASDIHIEPTREQVQIRFRVDGILQPGPAYPVALSPWIASRVKVLAKLDISERHRPQDGRVRTKMAGKHVDMRVSSLPVVSGEKIVIRLLGHSKAELGLEELGLAGDTLEKFREQVSRPQGMILVTGPTGSGKSTTLIAALMERSSTEVNIVTVEDPVEYEVPGLNQVPVNPKRGLTFPNALRAILRQDPDVIMIGEIRDRETGSIAAEAAMTGHLVLSSLHTNDAAGAVHRLIEMGVPKHLVAPSLQAVLAQRLLRENCKACRVPYSASVDELEALVPGARLNDITLMAGQGCGACEGTGYKGRVAVHELLVVDDALRAIIAGSASTLEIRNYANAHGTTGLRERALEHVFSGTISAPEFFRVVNI